MLKVYYNIFHFHFIYYLGTKKSASFLMCNGIIDYNRFLTFCVISNIDSGATLWSLNIKYLFAEVIDKLNPKDRIILYYIPLITSNSFYISKQYDN